MRTELLLLKENGSFKQTKVARNLLLNHEIFGEEKVTSLKTSSTSFLI